MQPPLNENLKQIADDMGISLYQRFSEPEGALFLRCKLDKLRKLQKQSKINFINTPSGKTEYFGYQLLEYLLESTSSNTINTPNFDNQPDRIIRAKEVQKLTGVSRTTLWRFENKGEFPRRVSLGASSVGWKLSEVQSWIQERQ